MWVTSASAISRANSLVQQPYRATKSQVRRCLSRDKDLLLSTGTLSASSNARYLGVTVDENLTFDVHARACSWACFYHFHRIRQVCWFLDEPATRQPVHAFVTSRLDYCNALLANSTVAVRQRRQRIQNNAARLVCSQPVYTRYAPSTKPKLAASGETYYVLTVSADVWLKYGSVPVYLVALCNACTDEWLRSTSRGDFVIPRIRTRIADSAFMVAVLSAWNALPPELRTITSKTIFHNRLKTYFLLPKLPIVNQVNCCQHCDTQPCF